MRVSACVQGACPENAWAIALAWNGRAGVATWTRGRAIPAVKLPASAQGDGTVGIHHIGQTGRCAGSVAAMVTYDVGQGNLGDEGGTLSFDASGSPATTAESTAYQQVGRQTRRQDADRASSCYAQGDVRC